MCCRREQMVQEKLVGKFKILMHNQNASAINHAVDAAVNVAVTTPLGVRYDNRHDKQHELWLTANL